MPKKISSPQATPLQVQEHVRIWGQAIRAQRMVQRITAAQLATRIGVSLPTVGRMEKGDPGVSVGAYLTALFALGLEHAATPALDASLWQHPSNARMRPTHSESGADLGYF
jgi:transcriptional regulator with XRE-family HTH domain